MREPSRNPDLKPVRLACRDTGQAPSVRHRSAGASAAQLLLKWTNCCQAPVAAAAPSPKLPGSCRPRSSKPCRISMAMRWASTSRISMDIESSPTAAFAATSHLAVVAGHLNGLSVAQAIFNMSFPLFVPLKSIMKAGNAFSMPSTMCSSIRRRPSAIHRAIAAPPSAKRGT
jgi:hypothetical protein